MQNAEPASQIAMLKAIPLFRNLTNEDLMMIAAQLQKVNLPSGAIVFREGDIGDSMYLVESGQVQVVGEDEDEVIALMGPGNFVGDLALLLEQPRTAALQVTIDAQLWALNKTAFDTLIDTRPTIALEVMRELSRRLVRTTSEERGRSPCQVMVMVYHPTALKLVNAIYETLQAPLGLVLLPGARLADNYIAPPGVIVLNSHENETAAFAEQVSHLVEVFDCLIIIAPNSLPDPSEDVLSDPLKIVLNLADNLICFAPIPPWLQPFKAQAQIVFVNPAEENLLRLARRLTHRVVGLALSSGGTRGLAHIGVLRVLARENIPIDLIAGSSAGALFGALYAIGWSYEKILTYIQDLKGLTHISNWDFKLPPLTGIVKGRKAFQKYLAAPLENRRFDQLDMPLYIVAADILTGEEVVFGYDSDSDAGLETTNSTIADAIRASVSIPVLPEPWQHEGRYLVDGGLVNPLPASVLRSRGANIIIASSVIQPLTEVEAPNPKEMPHLLQTISNIFGVMEAEIISKQLPLIDVLIQHNVSARHTFDFDQAEAIIEAGEAAAKQMLSVVRAKVYKTRGI